MTPLTANALTDEYVSYKSGGSSGTWALRLLEERWAHCVALMHLINDEAADAVLRGRSSRTEIVRPRLRCSAKQCQEHDRQSPPEMNSKEERRTARSRLLPPSSMPQRSACGQGVFLTQQTR